MGRILRRTRRRHHHPQGPAQPPLGHPQRHHIRTSKSSRFTVADATASRPKTSSILTSVPGDLDRLARPTRPRERNLGFSVSAPYGVQSARPSNGSVTLLT